MAWKASRQNRKGLVLKTQLVSERQFLIRTYIQVPSIFNRLQVEKEYGLQLSLIKQLLNYKKKFKPEA